VKAHIPAFREKKKDIEVFSLNLAYSQMVWMAVF
jgi:hypothetical protein